MDFRKDTVPLHLFRKIKAGLKPSKIRFLQSTIILVQNLNLFVFPFPVRWAKENEKYKISRSLLKYYWLVIVYKLVHVAYLATMGALSLKYEQYKCDHLSLPIWFTNVVVMAISSLTDTTLVLTADEVVNSFNWSHQWLSDYLTHIKIGKLS